MQERRRGLHEARRDRQEFLSDDAGMLQVCSQKVPLSCDGRCGFPAADGPCGQEM